MTRCKPLILLCAGGTGGHMFPARALAEELLLRGYRVALACDDRGMKYFGGMDRVDIHILSSGTYRPGLVGKIRFLAPLFAGYIQAFFLVRRLKPAVAVGFGGYPSAPPLYASQHFRVPTVLHEQNAILGLANILLLSRARRLALSWDNTTGIKPNYKSKCVVTGNPIRKDIAEIGLSPYAAPSNKINLFIVGGSQGAAVFSNVVPKALLSLPAHLRSRLSIIQQARPDSLEEVIEIYKGAGIEARVQSFFTDMQDCIRTAHLLITRSGASTVAELAAAGRPAVFVPYPWNRDNQQSFNAEALTGSGGGWMIQEKDLTTENLAGFLETILSDPQKLDKAANQALKVGKPDSARLLADLVLAEIA